MKTRYYAGRPDRMGSGNPNAKLSDAQVRMLREYRAGGWTHGELSFLFEISPSRSSEICRGLAYPDAGGPIDSLRNYNGRRGRPPG